MTILKRKSRDDADAELLAHIATLSNENTGLRKQIASLELDRLAFDAINRKDIPEALHFMQRKVAAQRKALHRLNRRVTSQRMVLRIHAGRGWQLSASEYRKARDGLRDRILEEQI